MSYRSIRNYFDILSYLLGLEKGHLCNLNLPGCPGLLCFQGYKSQNIQMKAKNESSRCVNLGLDSTWRVGLPECHHNNYLNMSSYWLGMFCQVPGLNPKRIKEWF